MNKLRLIKNILLNRPVMSNVTYSNPTEIQAKNNVNLILHNCQNIDLRISRDMQVTGNKDFMYFQKARRNK